MKKRIFPQILAFSLFAAFFLTAFGSCSQIESAEEESLAAVQAAPGYCSLRLSLGDDSSSRAVFPSAYDITALYYKFSYLPANGEVVNFPPLDENGATYTTLTSKTFTLVLGEYLFSLDAYSDSACTKKVLECTEDVTLTASSTSLELALKSTTTESTATATGDVSVTMDFPASVAVSKVTAQLVEFTKNPSGTGTELEITESGSTKSVTYTKSSVPSDTYILYFTLSGDDIETTVIPELVIVASGKESTNASEPLSLSEDLVNTHIIYVSSSGSDETGSGTKSAPLATIDRAVALINSKNKTSVNWSIFVSGTVTGTPKISSLNAASLTICGTTGSGTDALQSDGTGSALRIMGAGTVKVNLSKLTLTGGKYSMGGGLYVGNEGAIVTLGSDVVITGNENTNESYGGGGIGINGGLVICDGATIKSNTAIKNGGGVYIFKGEFSLENGTIGENTLTTTGTDGNGAGVIVAPNGTFTMTGGEISGNAATSCGGGVYVSGAFTMSGGTIGPNTAQVFGGGIYNEGTLSITSGTISENTSSDRGGGIYNKGTLTISGGEVSGNKSTGQSGGGIFSEASLSISDAKISGNSAQKTGGGICNNSASLIMENCEIFGNTAGTYGAGVYTTGKNISGAVFALTGCNIHDNTAAKQAGGVDSLYGALTLTDCTIKGNEALSEYGGGLLVNEGSCVMSGGEISGNTAGTNGNGVRVNTNGTFTMNGTALVASDNDVYLPSGNYITVGSTLSATAPVATITPSVYNTETKVLDGTTSALVASERGKFAVTPDPDGASWVIMGDGKLMEVTGANAASIISTMTSGGTLKISGAVTAAEITEINRSLKALATSSPDARISLDLSDAEITSLSGANVIANVQDYYNSFVGCTNLESVILPNTLESIGEYAFAGCSNLKSVTIPASVKEIGAGAFSSSIGPNLWTTTLENAYFEETNGWTAVATYPYQVTTNLSSADISNSSKAASYLTGSVVYAYYKWTRN